MTSLAHVASAQNENLQASGQRAGADSGDPQLRVKVLETGTDAQAGIWECEPGGWEVINRSNSETCYILSGKAKITEASTGEETHLSEGSFVLFPPGWSGRWDVTETVRKAYSIF